MRIPLVSGTQVEMTIPPGSQPEELKKLSGKGVYDEMNKKQGDLFIRLKVIIPRHLTEKQKKLLQEFGADQHATDHHTSSAKERAGEPADSSFTEEKKQSTKDWIKSKMSGCDS